MTEAQARARLRKLLAITLTRGAASGEQANATRAIGMILQEHPTLRDMIMGHDDKPGTQDGTTSRHGATPEGTPWTFWKGVLLGVGGTAMALGALVLASLFQRRSDL